MQVRFPEQGDHRTRLLTQVPFGFGLVVGTVLGVQFAPSPLLATLRTLVSGLVGLGTDVAVYNWRVVSTADRGQRK